MHRSGASLTARVLNRFGFSIGTAADPSEMPGSAAQAGAQPAIAELNEAILETFGGTCSAPPEMPVGWQRAPELEPVRARAREILDACFPDSDEWLFNDPRASVTLPFWRELLPQAGYLVCLRSPADVAASLMLREPDAHTWDSVNALWLRYSAQALEHTSGAARLLVFYDDYFSDPGGQLARLADFVGRDLSDLPAAVNDELLGLVDADLRHHRTPAQQIAGADSVPVEARAFYLAVRAAHMASAGQNGRSPTNADTVEPALGDAIEDFVPRLWREARQRQTAMRRERDAALAVAKDDRDRARREERHARAALDRALDELEGIRAEVDAGDAGLGGPGGAIGMLGLDSGAGRRDPALAKAREEASDERRARIAIEQSISWRVTRPLRSGKVALAGPRRRLSALRSRGS